LPLAIHGGAGNFDFNDLDSLEQHAYRMAIDSALNAGVQVLNQGGSACDAVVEVVCYLEDNPCSMQAKEQYLQTRELLS
jgi:beta-aspartyl-peptidase (threonine type)